MSTSGSGFADALLPHRQSSNFRSEESCCSQRMKAAALIVMGLILAGGLIGCGLTNVLLPCTIGVEGVTVIYAVVSFISAALMSVGSALLCQPKKRAEQQPQAQPQLP